MISLKFWTVKVHVHVQYLSSSRGGEWYLEKRGSRKILAGSRNLESVFDKSRNLVFAWFVLFVWDFCLTQGIDFISFCLKQGIFSWTINSLRVCSTNVLEFCLKQGRKISDFCLKQGQGMRGRAAPLHPRIYRVPPPPPGVSGSDF